MPRIAIKAYQKSLTNRGSRSEIRLFGTPKSLTTRKKNNRATPLASNPSIFVGTSLTNLVNLSTKVRIADLPYTSGSVVIKSIDHDSNFSFGIGRGYNLPDGY